MENGSGILDLINKRYDINTNKKELTIQELLDNKDKIEEMYNRNKYNMEFLQKEIQELDDEIADSEKEISVLEQTNLLLTKIVGERTGMLKEQIEGIVNDGLSSIFGDVSIKIESSIKRNKTEYSIKIIQGDVEGGLENFGGGVTAVIAFTLRVLMIVICKRDRILFLDESLGFVSEQYQEKLSEFIKKLCDNLGFIVILISHQPKMSLHADIVYEAYKSKDNSTKFKRMDDE